MKRLEQIEWEEDFFEYDFMKYEPIFINKRIAKCNFCKQKTDVVDMSAMPKLKIPKIFLGTTVTACHSCLKKINNLVDISFSDYSKIQFKSIIGD